MFDDIHPWVNVEGFLRTCWIGKLVDENQEDGQFLKPKMVKMSPQNDGFLAGVKLSQDFKKATLMEIQPISHDSKLLRFQMPDGEKCVIGVGQHIKIKSSIRGKPFTRPYTPISSVKEETRFDLLVKIYVDGAMTPYLNQLKVGDTIDFVVSNNPFVDLNVLMQCNEIGMIAGGTGITPMLKIMGFILDTISADRNQPIQIPKMHLLFSNRTVDDILLRTHLDELQSKFPQHLRVVHTLTQEDARSDWKGERGRITKEMIERTMPRPSPNNKVLIFICGPILMVNSISNLLISELGFPNNTIYTFI